MVRSYTQPEESSNYHLGISGNAVWATRIITGKRTYREKTNEKSFDPVLGRRTDRNFISHFDFLYLQKARKPIKRRKHNDAIIHFGHSLYTDARCQVY